MGRRCGLKMDALRPDLEGEAVKCHREEGSVDLNQRVGLGKKAQEEPGPSGVNDEPCTL